MTAPTPRLVAGLVVSLLIIVGFTLYSVVQIRDLRDEQTAISERNRLDSLQLLRIQNNLSTLATSMRDMADRTEPYPMPAWRQTFDRLRADLAQAIEQEKEVAPVDRPAAQQARLDEAVDRYWAEMDEVFARAAAGAEDEAAALLRTTATARHMELVGLVSQFLVMNNRVQEEAAQINRAIYGRVERELFVLLAVLLVLVGAGGVYVIRATRRAFDDVQRLSAQLRHLSWRMMRLQEDLQQHFSRELHDEFGQILAAMGTLLGRVKRNLPEGSPIVADVEEVRGIAQETLEKIRTESRLLRPVILDDFGLENALEWYVEQFGRQHGIAARFEKHGDVGVVPPETTIHFYRIVQEALTNVSRHSGAKEVWVRLSQADGTLALEVEDRGRGLPGGRAAPAETGIGLISMRERAELMRGTFSLRPAREGGLVVSVRVPLAGA